MPEHLPEVVDAVGLAEKGRHLTGYLALSDLDRLLPLLVHTEGQVGVDLQFQRQGRLSVITGQVSAELAVECQCCLEPMLLPVSAKVRLGVVSSLDAALALSEDYEALIVDESREVVIRDIVQDELLLAIPAIPQHLTCQALTSDAKMPDERPNPFAALQDLKPKKFFQE